MADAPPATAHGADADAGDAEAGSSDGGGHDQASSSGLLGLGLGALGVVFGDIGTSPLYAFREAFEHQHIPVVEANALGLASLAFWALVIIISIKYLTLVMRADNHGEGGILALTALVMPKPSAGRATAALVMLGVFGTALLYGDGLITPAISVLSAVEGFSVASSAFDDFVLPLAVIILVVLFVVQRRGTGGIGRVFGPVMVVWFAVLAALGLTQIVQHPSVVKAVNPAYIVELFAAQPLKAFLALGSIFLVVTGGEALYADMGHFGRRPIAMTWYAIVLPGLLLCYFGQAALLIRAPAAIENPFYRMAPDWGVTPLAILATMASVIASQALISGAFSLTTQAVQLDYLPRVKVAHTSGKNQGQVYVPLVNWALMIGCLGLVLGFRTPSKLAAAYGIAVTTTMVITSILFYVMARRHWGWSTVKAALVVTPLLVVDSAFLAANVRKIPEGGWFPLLVALVLLVQMATWRRGRQLVAIRIGRGRPLDAVLAESSELARVDGTAVFLFRDLGKAPPALVNNILHNKVLHRNTLIVCVRTVDSPRVDPAERAEVTEVEAGVHQVLLRFGFMEEPDVPAALAALAASGGLTFAPEDATYFLGRESVLSGKVEGMHPLLEKLFGLLNRGADSAARFFNLPPEQVFEVGTRVEI